jgi:hypothetical protein
MTKTQIQFPDSLYERIKALAAEQGWSVAETLRRGAELLLATRPISATAKSWKLAPPANTQILRDPFADDDWRLEASQGTAASQLAGLE